MQNETTSGDKEKDSLKINVWKVFFIKVPSVSQLDIFHERGV